MVSQKPKVSPNLAATMQAVLRAAKLSINCVQVGTIVAFDPANQTASISIAMKAITGINEDGTKVLQDYPVLLECPVMVLQGGSNHITFPITAGDSCIILFNDRQIDEWLNFGDGRDPKASRFHDISDGIAIVGLNPFTKSIADFFTAGIQILHNAGSKIELSDDLIASVAATFDHTGDMDISEDLTVGGNFYVEGQVYGQGGNTLNIDSDIVQVSGREIHAGNGATGTFDTVTVVDGIVISGS